MKEPLFSIILPVYNPRADWFRAALDSVINQTYSNWELCIADDASTDPCVHEILEAYVQKEPRIKCVFRQSNGHISEASNSALELASGEWIVLMDHDDVLNQTALEIVAQEIQSNPRGLLFYSDEDKISDNGKHHSLYAKCDWNRDLFYSHNLISHLGVYQHAVVKRLGGFRKGLEGSQDYDLALRCLEVIGDEAIRHIPKTLYHWRAHSASTASGYHIKPYVIKSSELALNEHFSRTGVQASSRHDGQGSFRAIYPAPKDASVEFLILYSGKLGSLEQLLNALKRECNSLQYNFSIIPLTSHAVRTLYELKSIDALIGKYQVLENTNENLAKRINKAVEDSSADFLYFIRETFLPLREGGVKELISHAARPGVGAVGGMILERGGRVEQTGLLLDQKHVFSPAFHHFRGNHPGYMGRLQLIQNFSAIGIDGLTTRRELFLEVGGFDTLLQGMDELGFDLSMKLGKLGLRNIYTPYARILNERRLPRINRALNFLLTVIKGGSFSDHKLLLTRWKNALNHDPCYGQNLNQRKKNFSINKQ